MLSSVLTGPRSSYRQTVTGKAGRGLRVDKALKRYSGEADHQEQVLLQGGVPGVPGGAAVGEDLAVTCAGAGSDGDCGLPTDLRRFFLGWSTLGRPSRGDSEASRSGHICPGWLPRAGQDSRWYPSASRPSLRLSC
jgi:hypothetical protein